MDKLAALKRRYLAEEAKLIREAFEATGWSMRRAAAWLALSTPSSLQSALRRHPELDAERLKKRGGE